VLQQVPCCGASSYVAAVGAMRNADLYMPASICAVDAGGKRRNPSFVATFPLGTALKCPRIVYTDLNGLFCKVLEEAYLSS
jgi:hypothetical protein